MPKCIDVDDSTRGIASALGGSHPHVAQGGRRSPELLGRFPTVTGLAVYISYGIIPDNSASGFFTKEQLRTAVKLVMAELNYRAVKPLSRVRHERVGPLTYLFLELGHRSLTRIQGERQNPPRITSVVIHPRLHMESACRAADSNRRRRTSTRAKQLSYCWNQTAMVSVT